MIYQGLNQWQGTFTVTANGAYTVRVNATDKAGNKAYAGPMSITGDITPPSLAIITSPTGGAFVKDTIWVNATAADAIGIKNVIFYRDAAVLLGTAITAPYGVQWNTTGLGGVHTLYVRAFDNAGNYRTSTNISVTVITIPTTPQNLQAVAGDGYINLTWQAPSANGGSVITNYKIYRGTSSGAEIYLITVGNILTYTNTGLINGRTYYYKISAVNGMGEGNLSIEVHAKPATKPNAPQNLLILIKNGKIVIFWHIPSDNGGDAIIGYKIYRGTSSGNETYFVTIDNISSFTDTNSVNGQTYYYRITAVNAMGESAWSGEVVAMVYISKNGNQLFNLIIIFLLGAVVLVVSGFIIHFNRKMKSLESKIVRKTIQPLDKTAAKPWKRLVPESFAVEDQLSQLPIPETEKELLYGKISVSEAKTLWVSLMQRFNRLYKLEKWAQALILLETLFEIAAFLDDDDNKLNDLLGKYEEIQKK